MTCTYTLHIDAYTPETIPMARLALYMRGFATLLGHERAVHFETLGEGSTRLVARTDFEDVPKVRARLAQLAQGEGDAEAVKARDDIDRLLAGDNATGAINESGGAEVIRFPGIERPKPTQFGPFTQEGTLDGDLVSVSGSDATIHLQLLNGDVKYTGLETDRDTARRIARHMFEPVRVHGAGRWLRDEDGSWALKKFRVREFEVLRNVGLRDAVEELRAVEGSDWKRFDDPVAALKALRDETGGLH